MLEMPARNGVWGNTPVTGPAEDWKMAEGGALSCRGLREWNHNPA